jgi:hypothetical protein
MCILGGSRHGIRLISRDGWTFEFTAARDEGVNILHRRAIQDTETFRRYLVVGSTFGVENDWYLGHGVAVRLDLGIGLPLPGSILKSAVRLAWYPMEALRIEIGYDLFRGLDVAVDTMF